MDYIDRLHQIITTATGKVSDVFFELYCIIEPLELPEQINAIDYVCNTMFFDGTDETYVVKQHFTPEQAAKARKKAAISFTPELERLIEECSKKCVAPKDFYSKIWSIIQSSTFRTKREKAIALFFLVNHDLIPYRPVGLGISMEQKKYVNILESLPDSMWDDTRYLLKLNYEQKTQRASILLDKLLALSNKEDQIVYLAALLDEVKQNAQEEVKESVEYALENI